MGKLRVFFPIALIVVLLPQNAFGRDKKGNAKSGKGSITGAADAAGESVV